MAGKIDLNGTWGLTWAEGPGLMNPDQYTAVNMRGRKMLKAAVPAPIHNVLMDLGLIEDPNVGLNSLKARWVEEQFWIYRHTFTAPEESIGQNAWLVFDKLEFEAVVWLNGQEVGRHANAHRPARFDVTGRLQAGENLLIVKVSTGIHSAADKPGAEYHCHLMDLLTKPPLASQAPVPGRLGLERPADECRDPGRRPSRMARRTLPGAGRRVCHAGTVPAVGEGSRAGVHRQSRHGGDRGHASSPHPLDRPGSFGTGAHRARREQPRIDDDPGRAAALVADRPRRAVPVYRRRRT